VDGRVEPPEGKIVSHLVLLGKETGWERWGSHPQGRGKYAETHYEVLQQWSKSAYVQLQPKTGRIHQLRIHFSEKQNPILGDHFYGKHFRCPYNPPRHLLHAKKLIMKHPISQKNLLIESPIPQDFQEAFHIFSGS
jgi:23S rRNA-/tRNA-specific pseudouridylate synthase